MVKVIGFDEAAKSRITCKGNSSNPGCGAINEYTQNDTKSYEGRDISGGPDGRIWINCGNCGKELTIRAW